MAALIELDLSADSTFDASDTPLISVNKNITIKPGKSKTIRVNVKALPAGVAAGSYFIVGQVTDSSGGISTMATAATLNVIAPTIDFSGVFKKSPSIGHVGKPLVASITVSNSGNVAAIGMLPIQVNSFDGTSNLLVGNLSQKINIKPGKSETFAMKNLIATTAGDYNLFITLDPNNTFGDIDTTNNLFGTAFPVTVT